MRSRDPVHTAEIDAVFRPAQREKSITSEVVKRWLQHKMLGPAKIAEDPAAWAAAPILCAGNHERIAINRQKAMCFAADSGRVVLKWTRQLVSKNTAGLDHDQHEWLAARFEAELTAYFVLGAPGVILENISMHAGIVNGTKCRMHSIVLDDTASDADKAALRTAGRADVWVLDGRL